MEVKIWARKFVENIRKNEYTIVHLIYQCEK